MYLQIFFLFNTYSGYCHPEPFERIIDPELLVNYHTVPIVSMTDSELMECRHTTSLMATRINCHTEPVVSMTNHYLAK
jgi:hypothetical protein